MNKTITAVTDRPVASYYLELALLRQIARLAWLLDRSKSWVVREALMLGLPEVEQRERQVRDEPVAS